MFPLLGGIASGVLSMFGASQTNQAQEQLAQQQDAFQEQMSNTAYTRATADMKNAGLNPMMMFGGGSAASTPSGVMPTLQNPMAGASQAMSSAVSSAVQSKVADATVDKMADEMANLKAQNAVIKATAPLIGSQTALTQSQAFKTDVDAKNDLTDLAVHQMLADKADTDKGFYDSDVGKLLRTLGTGGEETGRFFSPLSSILSSAKAIAPY